MLTRNENHHEFVNLFLNPMIKTDKKQGEKIGSFYKFKWFWFEIWIFLTHN